MIAPITLEDKAKAVLNNKLKPYFYKKYKGMNEDLAEIKELNEDFGIRLENYINRGIGKPDYSGLPFDLDKFEYSKIERHLMYLTKFYVNYNYDYEANRGKDVSKSITVGGVNYLKASYIDLVISHFKADIYLEPLYIKERFADIESYKVMHVINKDWNINVLFPYNILNLVYGNKSYLYNLIDAVNMSAKMYEFINKDPECRKYIEVIECVFISGWSIEETASYLRANKRLIKQALETFLKKLCTFRAFNILFGLRSIETYKKLGIELREHIPYKSIADNVYLANLTYDIDSGDYMRMRGEGNNGRR